MQNIRETKEAKAKLVSELRTMPPCLDNNYPGHSTLEPKANDISNEIEIDKSNHNDNDTPPSPQKRKNSKNNSDDFVFPSKTAPPTTPTPVLQPIDVQNSFSNLEQDLETSQNQRTEIPLPKPPTPFFLNIKKNYREQLSKLMKHFPNLKSKSSGNYLKLNIDSHDDHRNLINFMDEDRDIEFYAIQPKENKPIKVVIKGLPGCHMK
ncbi:hypothetical protein TNCV_4068211 [Trichonephila clavipes]|nr:hypothetical protein TNCV_4068211 [Trichonephila clavipes]